MKIDHTPQEAADLLGVAYSTLAGWRSLDRGDHLMGRTGGRSPAWVEVRGRCRGYTKEAIQEWIAKNTAGAR